MTNRDLRKDDVHGEDFQVLINLHFGLSSLQVNKSPTLTFRETDRNGVCQWVDDES